MSKPWDKLRETVPRNEPIGCGSWEADYYGLQTATVHVLSLMHDRGIQPQARIKIHGDVSGGQFFSPNGLRQLAEFCNELADQLEGR